MSRCGRGTRPAGAYGPVRQQLPVIDQSPLAGWLVFCYVGGMTGKQEITIPAPYHRWLKNEDPYFDTKRKPDYCVACGVVRHPLSDWASDLAAGPCPEKPWKQVWAEEIAAAAAAEHEAKIRKDMGR